MNEEITILCDMLHDLCKQNKLEYVTITFLNNHIIGDFRENKERTNLYRGDNDEKTRIVR